LPLPWDTQLSVLAGIVKTDDLGLYLMRKPSGQPGAGLAQTLGRGFLRKAPVFMKILAVAGTTAMFLMGGNIVVYGLPVLHYALAGAVPWWGW
jgi:uncharacterized protein